jgi:hypothetical protein
MVGPYSLGGICPIVGCIWKRVDRKHCPQQQACSESSHGCPQRRGCLLSTILSGVIIASTSCTLGSLSISLSFFITFFFVFFLSAFRYISVSLYRFLDLSLSLSLSVSLSLCAMIQPIIRALYLISLSLSIYSVLI